MEQYGFNQQDGAGRTMPHAGDAERSVLGSMLIDAAALEISLEQLREEDFYVPANAAIFAAMRDIRAGGDAVDLVTLTAELERHGKLDQAGGLTYLTDLVTFVPTAANVQHYASLVESKSTQRALIRAGGEIIRDGMDDERDIEETLDAAEKRIYEISMRKEQGTLVPMDMIVPQAYNLIGELAQRRGKITGVPSGFVELDRLTNGFQKSDLIIVASRPAMGKTSFALNIAQYAAVHNHRSVVVFSLEMSSEQLVMRMLCTEASVDSQRIKEGLIGSNEMNSLMEVMDPMSRAKIYIDDSGNASVPTIRSKCRRQAARVGARPRRDRLSAVDAVHGRTQERQPHAGGFRHDAPAQTARARTACADSAALSAQSWPGYALRPPAGNLRPSRERLN